MNDDLTLAYNALRGKQPRYDEYWGYYLGEHPLVYSTARLREVFRGLDAKFVENWCAVVVDVPLERLLLERIEVANDPRATELLQDIWARLDLDIEADDAHESLLVTGEAFFIVWPRADGGVTAYFNDSRLCHAVYDEDDPHTIRVAAKAWLSGDIYRLNLYYADRIEYYGAQAQHGRAPDNAAAFQVLEEPQPNPYGIVPIFHLRSGRFQQSALDNAIPLQAAINKLLADEMIAAEFGAFRQRYVISNADVSTLKNAPNEIWSLPSGDGMGQATSVGEFTETRLDNYERSIERRVASLSAITRIPASYFQRQGGQPLSGEALVVLEAPLTKRIQRIQQRAITVWQQLAAFVLALEGVAVNQETVRPVYADPATVQPRTAAEIRQISVTAGIPLATQLRREGWTEDDLDALRADRIAERADAQESLAQALLEQQRRFDQGQGE